MVLANTLAYYDMTTITVVKFLRAGRRLITAIVVIDSCFRKSLPKGSISTIDLLVLTSSDQLLLMQNVFTKRAYLIRMSTALILPLQ